MIPTEHIPARAGFTAVAALACGLGLSGCLGGGEKAAVRFVKGPAEKAVAQYPKMSLTPAAERFSARSVLLEAPPRTAAVIAVPTEAEAARAIRARPSLVDSAQSSAAKVDQIVSETTSDGAARIRIKACLKGATTTAAGKVATDAGKDWHEGRALSIDVEPKAVPVFSSCLKKAYPEAAPVTHVLGQALTRAMLASSDEVSQTDATAEDYVAWLRYSATLATEADVDPAPDETEVDPSAVEASVDKLLVEVWHAHRGRLAVRRNEWTAARDNRIDVISDLQKLQVAPELRRSRHLLTRAMQTSLESDRKHAECGSCAAPLDHRATAQKQAFIREYQPYLVKKGYEPRLDEGDF